MATHITVCTNDEEEFELEPYYSDYIGFIKEKGDKVDLEDVSAEDFLHVIDFIEWVKAGEGNPPESLNEHWEGLLVVSEKLGIPSLQKYCQERLIKETRDDKCTTYSWEEICKHSTASDCWIVIDNRVYDCTKWLPFHPGGELLLSGVQKDSTYFFELYHRSTYSFKLLQKYFIGVIAKEDEVELLKTRTPDGVPSAEYLEKLRQLQTPT